MKSLRAVTLIRLSLRATIVHELCSRSHGAVVGAALGACVGTTVGTSVGEAVGTVGALLGAGVGAALGAGESQILPPKTRHTPLAQSMPTLQLIPAAQPLHLPPPQSVAVSS